MTDVARYTAFTDTPDGGNPAGVVLEASGLDAPAMLAIAAAVGYSETAFVTAVRGDREYDVRYFAPEVEVPFCGHATIATAVALAERGGPGAILLHTAAGPIAVDTTAVDGGLEATLTSVAPTVEEPPPGLVESVLAALRWRADELDPDLPPRVAFAGARHLILAAATRARLAALDYDFAALRAVMTTHELVTVDLVHRLGPLHFAARNPFPVGGVVEDAATGAAAAAFGAYLRALGLVADDAVIAVDQGEDMGRPSRLRITLAPGEAGVRVSGTAVSL